MKGKETRETATSQLNDFYELIIDHRQIMIVMGKNNLGFSCGGLLSPAA